MVKASYKENIQKHMQEVTHQLTELQSSKHILSGQKKWNVFDQRKEALERQLKASIEEYQRIIRYSLNTAPSRSS